MIANGRMMKHGGHYENLKLQLNDYNIKTHMLSIDMGNCDIVLEEKWIHIVAPVNMEFKELCLIFTQHSHTDTLKGP